MMYDYKLHLAIRTPRACPWEQSVETSVNIEIPKDGGYNMCKAFEEIKKDAKLEGKLEGNKEGKTNTFFELTHEGLLSREIAAEKLNISLSEYTKLEKEFFDKKSATC